MPVSRTAIDTPSPSPSSARTCTATSPRSVNLTAFDSRLRRIWPSRWASASMYSGVPGSTVTVRARPFSRISGSKIRTTPSTVRARCRRSGTMSTLPASTFDRSRMSLISASRSRPAEEIVWANLTCSAVRLPSLLSASSLARIRAEFSGVRSSWLMLARNSLLYWLARSSSSALAVSVAWAVSSESFCSSSCAVCSSSSVLTCSSDACCASRRACDSRSARLCSSSSSLLTRSSSCCVCSDSRCCCVSSSRASSWLRSLDPRTATPRTSEARSSSSRSAAVTVRKNPSSMTAWTTPSMLAGATSSCAAVARPSPEDTVR